MKNKPVIYQVFTRLFGNACSCPVPNGSIADNGCTKMNAFTEPVLNRIHDMGVTHIWFTGILRHATQTDYSAFGIPLQHPDVVKGKAGSPYAVADYYDVDPDLAEDVEHRMQEWEQLISRTHKAGMKVVMDFVPNHVARQYLSVAKPQGVTDLGEKDNVHMHFSTKNNFYYCWDQPLNLCEITTESDYAECPAKATGNDRFTAQPSRNDWYETVKLNYGIDYCDAGGRSEHFYPIPDTWGKMTDILLFWAAKGVDAFRCDMAEMVPAEFWQWATDKVKFCYPDCLFIGEVYDPSQYRRYIHAGFDWLYDKVGMYDCLRDVVCQQRPAADITRQWQQNDDIRQHMLYFLENHDEQRIASDFFAADARKAFPALAVAALLFSNPFMLYAGQEVGERGMDCEGFSGCDGRTTIFDYWAIPSLYRAYFDRRKMKRAEREVYDLYSKILMLANRCNAIREGETFDLMYVNQHIAERQFAFIRKAATEVMMVVANFDDKAETLDINIPQHAFDYLNIPSRDFKAFDMLSEDEIGGKLSADTPVHCTVPAWGARVYQFKL